MQNDVAWLFERAPQGWLPQLGGAGRDKKAWWWRPGKKVQTPRLAPLYGATQLAFPPGVEVAEGECAVVWVGIDIDIDSPPTFGQVEEVTRLGCSVRLSSGGNGLHLIWRLASPVLCDYANAGMAVKMIAGEQAKRVRLPICSADRRMFWLWGGANRWLHRTDELYQHTSLISCAAPGADAPHVPVTLESVPVGMREWLQRIEDCGAVRGPLGERNRVHLGTLIPMLRAWGEIVNTRSGLSAGWHVNGHLDVGPDFLRLFSYADGGVIWSWSEPVALEDWA